MSRARVIYACQALFVGPAPSTGYSFLSYEGVLNNNSNNLSGNHNLLKQIDRITAVSYDFSLDRTDIKQLGRRTTAARPLINQPTIKLNVDYMLNGVKNEARFGFNVNFAQLQYPFSGESFYPNRVSPISGMIYPSLAQPTGEPFWPHSYKEPRNIYLVTCPEGQDLYIASGEESSNGIDSRVNNFSVLAFGDCYIDSYSTMARVGDVARASISFGSDNVCFYSSGSGFQSPSINPQTREIISGTKIVIPEAIDEGGISAIRPGDISVGISGIEDVGLNIDDSKITSYAINLDFNRESLYSLGYKNYLCRKINFPLFASYSIDTIVGDSLSGSFVELLKKDKNYDVTINLRSPAPCQGVGDVSIRYDLLQSKFEGISYSSEIGSNKTAKLNFTTELDPLGTNAGFFISGLLNISKLADYLMTEDGDYLTDEEGNRIVTNYIPLF